MTVVPIIRIYTGSLTRYLLGKKKLDNDKKNMIFKHGTITLFQRLFLIP
jgi:hypothetical protein